MNFNFYDAFGFLIELLIVQIAFLWQLPKKKLFIVRIILGIIGSFLFAWILYQIPFHGWTNLFRYTLLFLFTFVVILFSFSIPINEIIFYEVASYGVQHLVYNILSIFSNHLFEKNIYFVIHFICYFLLALIICFSFSYILKKNKGYQLNNSTLVGISAIILFITVVLSYFPVLYITDEPSISRIIRLIYASLCCLLALSLQFGLLVQTHWKQEAAQMKHLLNMDKKQYELTKNTIDLINTKSHDLKKQISLIRESTNPSSTEKALTEMEYAISNYDNTAKTGNKTLDLILSQKLFQAADQSISLTYMLNGHNFDFMETLDLFSLFGNILDNAIESVLQISNPEHRVIDLTATKKDELLLIRCDNYFEHPIVFKNGLPISSKNDSDYHGFGLKSIQLILEKYNGTLSLSTEDDIFHLFIMLPYISS